MPAFASVPSPTTSSTTCRSCGGAPSGKSTSGRCRWVSAMVSSSRRGVPSARVEDVDDEDQSVRAPDAEAGVARGTVAVVRRDHQQNPAADGLPDEPAVESGDDLTAAHGDRRGLSPPPRRVELAASGPDDADVLHPELLSGGHLHPPTHDDRLDEELTGRVPLRQ